MPRGCGYDVNGKNYIWHFRSLPTEGPRSCFLLDFCWQIYFCISSLLQGLGESEVPEGGRYSAICATELSTKDRLGTGRGLGVCKEGACDLSEGPSPCVPGCGDIAGGGGAESRVAKTLGG